MLRVVLDANVFVSALIRPEGVPGRIVASWLRERGFELIASAAILDELRRALSYPRVRRYLNVSEREAEAWVAALAVATEIVEGSRAVQIVLDDPDDARYLSAAVDGRADLLVTGDRSLLSLEEYEDVRILTPRAFFELLKR